MTTAVETGTTATMNRRFIANAMEQPLLTQDAEYELARRWREEEDDRAMHELVRAYMRLVVATAARFRGYGLPMSDLVQEGNVGLMQAAARFEHDRNVRFSTYASWWIRSAMQEFILRNWSIVRSGTSAGQKALFFNLRWLRARIEKTGGSLTDETRSQIAQQLNVSTADVERMAQRLSGRDHSLNDPVGEDGSEQWQDFLQDNGPTPEELTIESHDSATRGAWLREAIKDLTDREQMIITERMLQDDRATLEQLGERLGITKERVRQIESKAFEKLKTGVLRRWKDAEGPALTAA
ncbi:RNA polymerase factor sigma-32 [Marinibaculum pumilum]|uniref:RNA polymerase sigma factor n=1 Tax=Marinibaculum pumilum TaxID=1766165 RepID=A0ABV7L938_9PROT